MDGIAEKLFRAVVHVTLSLYSVQPPSGGQCAKSQTPADPAANLRADMWQTG